MVKETSIQKLEKSSVKLTATIGKDQTKSAYQKLLNEYSSKAQIKGFRPGKVPVSVLETKFGESLKVEAAQSAIDEALKEIFATIEEKPLPYAQPRLLDEEIKFIPGEDFTFNVQYDVYPSVEIKDYKGLTVEETQVTIGKEDLQKELEQIQDQNAIVTEVKEGKDAKVKNNDIVTASFVEIDEAGAEKPETKREEFVFTVGKKESVYSFDEEVLDMAIDAEKIFTKKYPADYTYAELADKSIKLKVKISRIRRKDLPALDDDLAQDVDAKYKTLDDLKKDIQARLEKTAADKVRQQKIESLLEQIAAKHSFDVPESMVMSQIYNQYDRMVRNFGGNESTLVQLLAAQGKTPEDLVNDWRPAAEKALKNQIIVQELIKAEKVEVSPADLDAEFAKLALESNMSAEETKKYYKDNNMEDYVSHELTERKVFDLVLAASTIKKGPKVKFVDLAKNNA